MRRRGGGVAAIQRKQQAEQTLRHAGEQMEELELEAMERQLHTFKMQLEQFARRHSADIKRNPQFRAQFQRMCAQVGVDPLASRKGFWSELLGVGDFYFELAVQVVDVCLRTRTQNGGLMDLDDLLGRVTALRSDGSQIPSIDDLERAIDKLKALGSGFAIVHAGSRKLCQSVPVHFSMDHSAALATAATTASTSVSRLEKDLAWHSARAATVLEHLVREGMAWVDDQSDERVYWFPAMWHVDMDTL